MDGNCGNLKFMKLTTSSRFQPEDHKITQKCMTADSKNNSQ